MTLSITLRVGAYPVEHGGKSLVSLDPVSMKQEKIAADEILEIRSHSGRQVLAKTAAPLSRDAGHGVIRLDRYLRQSLKVGIGEEVRIEKVIAQPVSRVFLLPSADISPPAETVVGHLQGMLSDEPVPVCVGSIIHITLPDDLGSGTFTVTSVEPGSGIITPTTEIELITHGSPGHEHKHELATSVTYEDLGGLKREIKMLRELVEIPLRFPQAYPHLGIIPPRGIIIHGPAGVGKTQLALAVANEVDAEIFYINGPEIVSSAFGETEDNLRKIFREAGHHKPSIVLIDELDVIAPKRGETGSFTTTRTVSQLLSLLDGLKKMEAVMVIGTTNRIESVDAAARRPGRFDRELFLNPPDTNGRLEILRIHSRAMPLSGEIDDHLEEIARKTLGFVGADLMELCREAGLNALRRKFRGDTSYMGFSQSDLEGVTVEKVDFEYALGTIRPSAMREVKVMASDIGWNDIGGLSEVKEQLRELVQMPLLHPEAFAGMKIEPPVGILLHGQPGTGKTLLAKALAKESEANFIPLKGTEVFSKWLGESEEEIRYIFQLARRLAPAIVFLDQVDVIAPRRGKDMSTQAAERVVSQLLAEMDSIQPTSRVVVVAATNRFDLIDPAILQASRFGIHIPVPLPDTAGRKDILRLYLEGVRLSNKVRLDGVIEMLLANTEGFSGADLELLCNEAKLFAVRSAKFEKPVPLELEHFKEALAKLHQRRTAIVE